MYTQRKIKLLVAGQLVSDCSKNLSRNSQLSPKLPDGFLSLNLTDNLISDSVSNAFLVVSEFLLRFNLIRATQSVGFFDAKGYVKQKGKENRGVKHCRFFYLEIRWKYYFSFFYLVNQKAPKTIELN